MLTLVLGTDWITVRAEILSRISLDVKNRNGGRILMVPELISHEMERRLCVQFFRTERSSTLNLYCKMISLKKVLL